ncbi:MAG: hypothetical protein AAF560_25385, partial [Acidobacteriota bacterium]
KFQLTPRLKGIDRAQLSGEWDREQARLVTVAGELEALDLARWMPAAAVTGTADAQLSHRGDVVGITVTLRPQELRSGSERILTLAEGATVELSTELPFAPVAGLELPDWQGPLTARIALPGGSGRWDELSIPAELFPLAIEHRGQWQADGERGSWRLDGETQLESPPLGRIETRGASTFAEAQADFDLRWLWRASQFANALALLEGAGLPPLPAAASGRVDARGSLRGPLDALTVAGRGRLNELAIATEAAGLTEADLEASWSWRDRRLEVDDLEASGNLRVGELAALPVTLEASAWSTNTSDSGAVRSATLASPGLGQARGELSWGMPDDEAAARFQLSLSELDLASWREVLPASFTSRLPAALSFQGTLAAELAGQRGGDGSWRAEGPVELGSAGFSDDDGSRVMIDLGGRWDVAIEGEPQQAKAAPTIRFDATGSLGGFQLLWGTFYGDFSQLEASLDCHGELTPQAASPWRLQASTRVPEGPRAELSLEGPTTALGLRYQFDLADPDLRLTHERYLASLLAEQLGQTQLSGALELAAAGSLRLSDSPQSWSARGSLSLTDFELRSGGGQATVQGLQLTLPFNLRRSLKAAADVSGPEISGPEISGPSLAGQLEFERLTVRDLEVPKTRTDLAIEADSVGLEQALDLDILGGLLTVERLTLRDLLRPGRHLEAGLRLSALSLEQISTTLGIFPLEGALEGTFPLARLSPDRLQVDGGGQIDIFGGRVELHDISGEDLLTRFPKIQLSADFEGIDLGRLTRRIDFGEMTGVLQGSVRDLELFRGVPVRFSAELETVETPGVPRTLDVKAINNLTILGTGQSTNIFDRGLQRFFKKYTYERLAVSMRLDDDVLLLRGPQQRGGKELFLSGRLPFRIDVVNAEPGRSVSFQAMMGRLRSLDFGSVKTDR